MKKFLAFSLILLFLYAYKSPVRPLFDKNEGVYTLTEGEASSGKFYTYTAFNDCDFYSLKNVCGQSLKTQNEKYIEKFLIEYDCVKVFEESVDGLKINYYYSHKICGYRSINGKKVNVQTSFDGIIHTVGSPLIYGGF